MIQILDISLNYRLKIYIKIHVMCFVKYFFPISIHMKYSVEIKAVYRILGSIRPGLEESHTFVLNL